MAHRHSPDSLEYNGFLHDSSLKQVGLKCDSIKNLRLLNATKRVARCDIPDIHITTQYDLLTRGSDRYKLEERRNARELAKGVQVAAKGGCVVAVQYDILVSYTSQRDKESKP